MASMSAQAAAEEMEGLGTEFQPSVLLTHPRTLFQQGDGSPMRFYLAPGPWKRLLAPLILHGGGVMSRLRAPGAILLAPPGQGSPSGPETYISALFVTECVRAGELLDLAPYSLRTSSRPKVPCCYHELVSGPPVTGRTPFTRAEDLAILMYLRDHLAPGATATGNAVWKEMGRVHLTRHSWQAMQARYLKKLRGREGTYQLEARTLIPTLVYPHCGTCRPTQWAGGAERGNCENSEAEANIGAPGEANNTGDISEGNSIRDPLEGKNSEDQGEGKGIGNRESDEDREEGPNTEGDLEGKSSRVPMNSKSKERQDNVKTTGNTEEEIAPGNPKKRKKRERTEDGENVGGLSAMQIEAEHIGGSLEGNACILAVEGKSHEPLNRVQVTVNVEDYNLGIIQQGSTTGNDSITAGRCEPGAHLGCLITSLLGEDKIELERKCSDQAAITSVEGVFSSSDKYSVSFTEDGELCDPLVSANGAPPQFQKADNTEVQNNRSSLVDEDQASLGADMERGMFSTESKCDGCEPLAEDGTDNDDGVGPSDGANVNRSMQSCTVLPAEFEERDFPVADEDRLCVNLLERVDDIPESMESSDEEHFQTKRRKRALERETEDVETIKDGAPIRQRKNGWYIDLESGEDEELHIKRIMKSTPVKGNLGIFEKANEEFQVEDDTPELVLDVGQNKQYHRSSPSLKEISGLTKPASDDYSRVIEHENSHDKNAQCSRSPEIQVCLHTQVLKQFMQTEDSNVAVLERWPKKNDHYSGSPELDASRPVLKLNQFVCCEDSQVDENPTPLEAELSSPTDSQREVDKATKNFQSLMKEFKLNLATVTQAFLKNSGELEATKYFLKHGVRPDGYPIWTRQDDIQLMNENDKLKRNLNNKFGPYNVKKRIAFLKS